MRQVMLSALLALALSTAAFANTTPISFSFTLGPTMSGGIGGNATSFSILGSSNGDRFSFTASGLSCGTQGPCTFGSGTMLLTSGRTVLFRDNLGSGTVGRGMSGHDFTADISALLLPGPATVNGQSVSIVTRSNMFLSVTYGPGGPIGIHNLSANIASGQGSIVGTAAAVPEPGALEGLLLGTGVIGLAGMARRKFKLGTPDSL